MEFMYSANLQAARKLLCPLFPDCLLPVDILLIFALIARGSTLGSNPDHKTLTGICVETADSHL